MKFFKFKRKIKQPQRFSARWDSPHWQKLLHFYHFELRPNWFLNSHRCHVHRPPSTVHRRNIYTRKSPATLNCNTAGLVSVCLLCTRTVRWCSKSSAEHRDTWRATQEMWKLYFRSGIVSAHSNGDQHISVSKLMLHCHLESIALPPSRESKEINANWFIYWRLHWNVGFNSNNSPCCNSIVIRPQSPKTHRQWYDRFW